MLFYDTIFLHNNNKKIKNARNFSIRNKSLDEKQVDYGVELYGQNHRLSFMSDGRQAVIPTGRGYLHNNDFLLTSHSYQDLQLSQQIDAIQKKASEELGFEVEFDAYQQKLAPRDISMEADELEKMAEALQSVAKQLRKVKSQDDATGAKLPAIVHSFKKACEGVDPQVIRAGEFAIYKSVGNNAHYFEQLERDPGLSKSVINYQHESIKFNNGRTVAHWAAKNGVLAEDFNQWNLVDDSGKTVIQEALDACDSRYDDVLPRSFDEFSRKFTRDDGETVTVAEYIKDKKIDILDERLADFEKSRTMEASQTPARSR